MVKHFLTGFTSAEPIACRLQQMTAAAVAREKAKLYAEFGRGGGEGMMADDLAPEEFLELEQLRQK